MVLVDVARVLVPGEGGVRVTGLDDVLLPEQVGLVAERGPADVGHQLAEEELPQFRAVLVDHLAEVALAPLSMSELVDSRARPSPRRPSHGEVGDVTQQLELVAGTRPLEDEVALVAVLLAHVLGDEAGRRGR